MVAVAVDECEAHGHGHGRLGEMMLGLGDVLTMPWGMLHVQQLGLGWLEGVDRPSGSSMA